MSNHNTITQSQDIQKNTNETKKPNYGARRALALGSLALTGALLAGGVSLVVEAIDKGTHKVTEEQAPTIDTLIMKAIESGPDNGPIITTIVEQGDMPGLIAQEAANKLNAIDNLGLLDGQESASFLSGQSISKVVHETTNGSVQPDDTIRTWRDDETNLIVSDIDKDTLVSPPQN